MDFSPFPIAHSICIEVPHTSGGLAPTPFRFTLVFSNGGKGFRALSPGRLNKMQVLLKQSETRRDIECSICGQGFHLYWERSSPAERETMRSIILGELRAHHAVEYGDDRTVTAHPAIPFNLPTWSGSPQFSGAALLGGFPGIGRVPLTKQAE
jgi:hypothetical protein